MNLTQLDKVIVPLLLAGKTLEIRSSPGRGKSEFTKSLPSKMAKITGKPWGFASCFLATMTPTDLMGYMVPLKDEKGNPIFASVEKTDESGNLVKVYKQETLFDLADYEQVIEYHADRSKHHREMAKGYMIRCEQRLGVQLKMEFEW